MTCTHSCFRSAGLFTIALLGTSLCQAQAPPAFEVASIKAGDPSTHMVRIMMAPGGRYTAQGVTLKVMIMNAYGVRDFQVTGGPSWIGTDRFDITATANADGQIPQEQVKLMLQNLLADRFKLVLRRESKEMPGYALVIAKGGSKLKETEGGNDRRGQMRMSRGILDMQGIKTQGLAANLANIVGRPVVDKTGLTGEYDAKLQFTPENAQVMGMPPPGGGAEPPPPNEGAGPSIFTAVQEQLGLKLEAQKLQADLFIVERAEKPTEN